jgi:hypothetical protein
LHHMLFGACAAGEGQDGDCGGEDGEFHRFVLCFVFAALRRSMPFSLMRSGTICAGANSR